MSFVYILQSMQNGRYYIGSTDDLERRLQDHEAGNTATTRHNKPWKLVYSERLLTLAEARRRERKIKSWKNPDYMVSKLGIRPDAGERPD